MERRGGRLAGGVLALVLALGCTGPTADPDSSAVTADPAGAPSASGAPASGEVAPSVDAPGPTETQAPVPDPPAPATVAPVERAEQPPGPRVSAPAAAVDEGVRYTDGLRVRVTGTSEAEVVAEGPGVIAGPVTTFSLSVINDSSRRVDLGAVVVTLVYGDPGRLARPSYDVPTEDLAGFAAPGGTRRASYAFAVSAEQLASYTLHVDLDGQHTPAVFTGPAA